MSSADEVSFVNTFYGANLAASAAIYAFFIVYRSKIVFYDYCAGWAGLFAFSAGDAAVFTKYANPRAFIVVVAGNRNASGISYKMNNAVGAFFRAKSATDAFSRIYRRNTLVVYANGISRANLDAVAVAEAGKRAVVIAGVVEICGFAGFRAVVVVFFLFGKAKTVAGNVSHLLDNVLGARAHNFGDFRRCSVTAGDTKVAFVRNPIGKRLCVSITAGKSASAAVCAGKHVADCKSSFILFDAEICGGNRKQKRAKHACGEKNYNRN